MKKLRILLIDATGEWLARTSGLADLEQVVLPVGLMSLSAAVKRQFGDFVEIRLVNRVVDCPNPGGLSRIVREFSPHVAGIRGLHIYRKEFSEAVKMCRSAGVPHVFGGGPYITSDPMQAMRLNRLDAGCVGEGEIVFVEIIGKILDNEDYRDIPGLVVRGDDGVHLTAPRDFIGDLDSLPDPDYDVIDLNHYEKYMTYGYNRRRQGVLVTSRGCPYRCVYCHNIFGRTFRARSADRVAGEIFRLYEDYGIRDFYIVDDNFNMDVQRLKRFCELLKAYPGNVRLYFTNGVRGDILTPELIDELIAAGTIWITFAVETASPRLQKLIRKNNDLDRLEVNIRHACRREIMVSACFMIGFPSETIQEAQATIEYIKQFEHLVLPLFFSVKYYPDTEIYQIARDHGIDLKRSADAYSETYHDISHSGTPEIPPRAFQTLYFTFLRDVFLSRNRLENAVKIQRKYLTEEEISDAYSLFFRRRVRNFERDVLRFAR